MGIFTSSEQATLGRTLDEIITHHGLWAVLRALAGRMVRRNQRVPPLALNDHLRRDIGMPPKPPPSFPDLPYRW